MRHLPLLTASAVALASAHAANAREYFVVGPVHQHDMEIVANYLVGIEMAPMPPDMPHDSDVIHLEADVHAVADNVHGYADGAWIPYLRIDYTVEKVDQLESQRQAAANDREGRAALRQQRPNERAGTIQADLPLHTAGSERLPAVHRQGNGRTGLMGAIHRGVHLRLSPEMTAAARHATRTALARNPALVYLSL
jgi:Fe2+ transport protein